QHQQRTEPQDPGNDPPRPAAGSVRIGHRRGEELRRLTPCPQGIPRMNTGSPRLGNILVEKGILALEKLQEALDLQKRSNGSKLLAEILIEREFCTEDQVRECLAQVYSLPYAKLEPRLADPKIVDVLPREYIEKNLVFPLFNIRGVLTVALSEPT